MSTPILSYKFASESAKALAKSLNSKRIRSDGDYKYKNDDLVINLGCSSTPKWDNDNVSWLNKPESVAIAVCKKKTFKKLKEHGVSIPEFTESRDEAVKWINNGDRVACRTILNGHSAAGLVVAHTINEMPQSTKLYVKYFPKKIEYRVHLIRDKESLKIFDYIQKKVKSDLPENEKINYEIRNHGQWIFVRENIELPNCVKIQAIKAADALKLDLCSVDICYQTNNKTCVVLECNTCSSLSGETTLNNYTNAIKTILADKVVDKVKVTMPKKNSIPPEEKQENPQPEIPAVKVVNLPPKKPEPVLNQNQELQAKLPEPTQKENKNIVAPTFPIPHSVPVSNIKTKKYVLSGVSDLEILVEGSIMKFYGKIANNPNKIRVMETKNGLVTHFWED